MPYTFFNWITFPKYICQGPGSFCLSFFRTTSWLSSDVWTGLILFYHSFTWFFSTSLGNMYLPGFSSCEQIKFSIRFSSSSVVIVRCLPESALLSIELWSWNLFNSMWIKTLLQLLLLAPYKFYKHSILFQENRFQWQLFLRGRRPWFPQNDTN